MVIRCDLAQLLHFQYSRGFLPKSSDCSLAPEIQLLFQLSAQKPTSLKEPVKGLILLSTTGWSLWLPTPLNSIGISRYTYIQLVSAKMLCQIHQPVSFPHQGHPELHLDEEMIHTFLSPFCPVKNLTQEYGGTSLAVVFFGGVGALGVGRGL